MTKRFTINVENENYENAYFENDEFLCYEDDYDSILQKLNDQHDRIRYLEKRNQNIINHVKTSMENERTHIGYNVLKQLLETIQ